MEYNICTSGKLATNKVKGFLCEPREYKVHGKYDFNLCTFLIALPRARSGGPTGFSY